MATLLADLDELEADHLEVVVPTATDLPEAGLENITIEGPQGGSQSFQSALISDVIMAYDCFDCLLPPQQLLR